ncbi:hypothetical protein DW826_13350 [Clostridium sp. AM34-11AC]|jgi:phosphotransferase system  glucose/maltose/N-acetylglucosamine-specific IIC component|uniref:hypothetical protein n=1 Tax=unclassified Clostridium TaxID=2614128 RepID=UPI000E41C5EB|nr:MULTISPECIES: hypothetical protein [Clostridia]MBT9822052.1 hypothetical protein [Clostridium sp. MCC328]RGE05536.1 hypothetical protein DW826_13350 [Clostridium sp. AM34-11AC]
MKMLDKICINAMLRANVAKDKLESFLEEQDGVSNVVATLLILVIVVTLVTTFWGRLQEWTNKLMDIIFKTTI